MKPQPYPRATTRLAQLVLLIIISAVLGACTLVGPPEQSLDQTDVPTNTVPPTRTPIGTVNIPTARPTVTPLPLSGQNVPTAVGVLPPTAILPQQPRNTPLPISIVILSPVPGSVIADNVQILGAAAHPQFLQYQVEYGPDPNPNNLWFPASGVVQSPVINGLLGIWNTTGVNDDTYQIRLRVTLNDGTSLSTVVNNIRVQNRQPTPIPTATTVPRPIAAFTQSSTTGQAPLVVNFINQSQGTITGYQWTFGDGGSSAEINPTHTFRNPGVYTVVLTARGPGGSSNVSRQITVQSVSAPTAGFTQDRVSGESPLTVQFTDQSSGNITSRTWQFGDGTTSDETNPEHTFVDVGTYNVILSVAGPGGSSSVRRQITVEDPTVPPPDADFSASVLSGESPLSVQFSVASTDNVDTYDWRINQQTFSNDANTEFTFTEEGTYTVELVVTGDGGQDTAQETITVTRPPDAPNVTIAAEPESGDVPLSVQFSSESTGGDIVGYTWEFGDGTTSADENPTHTYEQQGTYAVTLSVEGPGGTDTETLNVTATEPLQAPVAEFTAVLVSDDAGLTVNFNNLSTGDELSYVWDFGDGTTSPEANPQHIYLAYGTYDVTLEVSNPVGTDNASSQITLQEPLESVVAIASAAPLQAAPGETIQFDSSGSTGDIASYAWDFGDGTTSTEPNPAYTYQVAGTYTAQLTLTGQDNTTDTSTVAIAVAEPAEPLVAVASAAPLQAVPGETIQFDSSGSTGDIASYAWDFGDGTTSTEPNPAHTYQVPGTYTAQLTLTGQDNTTNTSTVAIAVAEPAEPLVAVASATPLQAAPGETIQFDSSGSTGDIASYAWDFGDGTTSTEPNPTHTYQAPGTYTAQLTLTGQDSTTSVSTVDVAVDAPLQAVFTANPSTAATGTTVQFNSGGSAGNITSYTWDFGDGTTSTDVNPTHTYTQPGQYTVLLVVSDGTTQSEATNPVTITPALQAAFVANPSQVQIGEAVAFDSTTSTGSITSYAWDFGDGTTSTEPNPTHAYQAPGTFVVRLTVSDGTTQSETESAVTVQAGLQAVFAIRPPQVNVGELVAFDSNETTGNVVSYSWEFGDGTTSTEPNPTHTYQAPGDYAVRLVVSDGTTQSEATNLITVNQGLQAAFVANPPQAAVGEPVSFDPSATSGGEIATFNWEFGDGTTSNEPAPTHTYQAPGDYTVTLIVNTVGGEVAQVSQPVTISDAVAPLPASDPVIVFASERAGNRQIYVIDADGMNPQRITDTGGTAENPDWGANDRIVFSLDGQLFTMGSDGSDVRPLSADGGATAVQGNEPRWSPDAGQIVFAAPGQDGSRDLFVINADGSDFRPIVTEPGDDVSPSWSPNGGQIAFATNRDGQYEIYVVSADGTNPVRLTDNTVDDVAPSWSPDGTRIAYAADLPDTGDRELFIMGADGTNPAQLTFSPGVDTDPAWTPDSSRIVFTSAREAGDLEIYSVNIANPQDVARLTESGGFDGQASHK